MIITYIGHSGFAIELADVTLIFDFYTDNANVINKIISSSKKIIVFVSHFHSDHFNPEILNWAHSNITYILSNDVVKRHFNELNNINYISVKKNEKIVIDDLIIHTFDSTDIGCSYLIKSNNKYMFHAGDLNNWCWKEESTEKEIRQAEGNFKKILKDIRDVTKKFDIVMFPVDARMGKDYFIGAKYFVKYFEVDNFIPMHFWNYTAEACDFDKYKNYNYGNYICLSKPGESRTII